MTAFGEGEDQADVLGAVLEGGDERVGGLSADPSALRVFDVLAGAVFGDPVAALVGAAEGLIGR